MFPRNKRPSKISKKVRKSNAKRPTIPRYSSRISKKIRQNELLLKPAIRAFLVFAIIMTLVIAEIVSSPTFSLRNFFKSPGSFGDAYLDSLFYAHIFLLLPVLIYLYLRIFFALRKRQQIIINGQLVYAEWLNYNDAEWVFKKRKFSLFSQPQKEAIHIYAKWEGRFYVSRRSSWDFIPPDENGNIPIIINKYEIEEYIFPTPKELRNFLKIHGR